MKINQQILEIRLGCVIRQSIKSTFPFAGVTVVWTAVQAQIDLKMSALY